APTLALTEAQRGTIFFFGSVETIVDSEGTHTHPFAGAVRLTEEADSVDLGEGGGLILGDSSTLNPADTLAGGNGRDVLALFGGGVFRLDQLTAFTGFDALQLVNLVSGSASLWLPEDCAIDLALTGDGVEVVVGDGYSGSITSDAFMAQFSLGSGSSATIVATAGDTNTFVLGDNSTLTITATGRHNEFVIGDNATTTITATGSSGSFYLGTGRETITGGSGTDRFRVEGVGDLAADDMLDGGEGTDDAVEITLPDGSTFDLTAGIVLMNIDRLSFYCADGVLLMSQASLAGLSQLGGAATARMITGEATLDLSGMSVSDIKIASSHADGTVFTVDSVAAALQVFGGPGEDTISAPELTFTAEELEAIFLGGSIEIVRDASGNHTSGGSGNFEPGLLLA
ncbi:MAG TPA: hypothetical protein VFK86_09040, partial [Bauldia sp.]|nr:hypothetical protein [Bauldia sp.]